MYQDIQQRVDDLRADNQQASQSAQQGGVKPAQHEVRDRIAGIVSLTDGEATQKSKKVIDFARKCPAKWARFTKNDNINLPLFVYGSVSELEATLCGRADPLPEGDFLAKIRHLKNVIEVCCINSNDKEHLSYMGGP